ncbi:Superkiller protein 3 [Coemansia spiralis]|uniref:Superkiller protein 3 n=2 Tax=Coemansia TaxID=4863 RepID=A0A9W8KVJ1_9FUNG|nr:Superkiller protein 3 [Coemansia umbellata]KAJ2619347.1 Superkiller protein 3 [Coemansia sp. RSA 1358]KAJ2669714.1 Superkiller protein 3 [Coemansia spiralis]
MSAIFKTKLKAAKIAVTEKNYDYAYDLCHDLLELDEPNYNVYILLGISCQNLEKWDEGEKAYKKAIEMPKANILAWQGICALYEAAKATDKYELSLKDLQNRFLLEGNKEKAWETTSKLILLAEQSGDTRKLIDVLRQLTADGPLCSLLDPSIVTAPTPPSLPELLMRIYSMENELDIKTIEKEINKRKTRLDAGPIAKVRKDVKSEVWGQSGVLDTLKQLIFLYSERDNALDQKLHFEERYFNSLMERIPTINDIQARSAMSDDMVAVAWDLVLHEKCASAFEHLMSITYCDETANQLSNLVKKYIQIFPGGRMVPFVEAWSAAKEGSCTTIMLDFARDSIKECTESPFAYVQLVQVASSCREHRLVIDSGIASREVLRQFNNCFGTNLWQSQLAVDMNVADAYMEIGPEHAGDADYLYRKCLEVDPGNARAILGLGLSLCAQGNYDESRQLLSATLENDPQNHLALGGLGYVAIKEGKIHEAVDYLQKAIDISPNHAVHHVNMGNAYWQMGGKWQQDKQFAYTSWIKAARIDSNIAEVFCGLGKWYQNHGNDDARAKKCFSKAVDLDHANGDAGQMLAEIYIKEGSDDLCEELLVQATEARHDQKWAWGLLGFLRLRQDNYEQAIIAFRSALGLDRNDRLCWEGLCQAYMGIGRLNTAAKVAQKVVELDPFCVSGHWLRARACLLTRDLELSLQHFDLAIDRMETEVSDNSKTNTSLLWAQPLAIGRAECLVSFAEKWYADGFFGRAVNASNHALCTIFQHILRQNKPISERKYPVYLVWSIVYTACIWNISTKSIFDSHPELACIETVRALIESGKSAVGSFKLPRFLAETVHAATEGCAEIKVAKGVSNEYTVLLFQLAQQSALLRILTATSPMLASAAWVDLGRLYYERKTAIHPTILQPEEADAAAVKAEAVGELLSEAAARCALAAIQLDAGNANAYNLQGVVASCTQVDNQQQAALAQHAFIMASRHSPGSAVPWANLGYLYMHHGDIELANRAFSEAQRVDPEFAPGWVGQAIIAETLGSSECVELFETCLFASTMPKAVADYGYAKQVWRHAVEHNEASVYHRNESVLLKGESSNKNKKAAGYSYSTTGSHTADSKRELSVREQNRLVFAIYAVRRYIERTGDSRGAPGRHLLGLLLEQSQEYENAAATYLAAYDWVASEEHDKVRLWVALTHLGRAQCSAEMYDNAVETYEKADALLSDDTTGEITGAIGTEAKAQTLYFTLGYSLALFFAGRLEESLGRFEQALVQTESIPSVRPLVAVMLAQVMWALGTNEHRELGRQHLLEVISEHTDFLPGLSSLFAMGVLQGDDQLIGATYTELQKARSGSGGGSLVVAKLESCLAAVHGDAPGGRRALTKAVHRHPDDGSLWLLLAEFEALCGRQDAMAMGARVAFDLFRLAMHGHISWGRKPSQGQVNSATLDVAKSALVVRSRALMANASGRSQKAAVVDARSAAKRAVMYHPWSQDAWNCLSEAFLSEHHQQKQ